LVPQKTGNAVRTAGIRWSRGRGCYRECQRDIAMATLRRDLLQHGASVCHRLISNATHRIQNFGQCEKGDPFLRLFTNYGRDLFIPSGLCCTVK
jgi:hypothetical protein